VPEPFRHAKILQKPLFFPFFGGARGPRAGSGVAPEPVLGATPKTTRRRRVLPGFDAIDQPSTSTLNQTLIMAKRDAVPKTQTGYLKWHDTLKGGLTPTTTGATAADVAMLAADNATLHAKMTAATTADNASKAAHTDLNNIIASSQKNVRALAQRIKKSLGYTTVLGDQLGIEGVEDSVDMTQQKPALTATAGLGGVVEIGFNKLDAEGVHIYSMRDGDAGFTLLASETHSPYVDNRPLLTAGKPEVRQYKAVFFLGKGEIGLPSDIVPATAAP
jgi:hypothetical protein